MGDMYITTSERPLPPPYVDSDIRTLYYDSTFQWYENQDGEVLDSEQVSTLLKKDFLDPLLPDTRTQVFKRDWKVLYVKA